MSIDWLRRFAILALGALACGASVARDAPQTPAEEFGSLYSRVESSRLYPDSKTFADAVPLQAPQTILDDYARERPGTNVTLRSFIERHFTLPAAPAADAAIGAPTEPREPLAQHIAALWHTLSRAPLEPPRYSSQLPLAHPYVVPGGRFREIYYWDSYFTMLGLMRDGESALARGMVDNFADLIERYGHVPNGSRTYYLSRSQPPVFFLMVGLLRLDAADIDISYLNAMRTEHAFWMRGARTLARGHASGHVVRLADGTLLNRYWDALDTPRDESWLEDVRLAAGSSRPAPALYRDLRSAAESGWDFSSRWLLNPKDLATIETTAIVPVDLNSLLYGLERAISAACARRHDGPCELEFGRQAQQRRQAIDRYLWDPARQRYGDYQWRTGQWLDRPSAAMLYPLFVGVASDAQARGVAAATRTLLLAPGGLLATPLRTGQQWDAPNGWAPLQWIAVRGLADYGHAGLAADIAHRWLATVTRVYDETGRLLEKYDVAESLPGGGGEYPTQDGFGWTNGVTRELLARYPPDAVH